MKELQKAVRTLQIIFTLFLVVPLLYAALSLAGGIHVAFPIGDAASRYVYDVCGVLVTLLFVPLSLKSFSKLLQTRVLAEEHLVKALRRYLVLSIVRLSMLLVAAAYNIVLYFSVNCESAAGLLCFCICLLSFAFCVPTAARVKGDLGLGD